MHGKDSSLHSIVCLSHRIEAIANKYIFMPMNLSSTSVAILGMLAHHKSLTPSQILEMSNSTKSNISQRLRFLEKEGLITRDYGSDKLDKRKVKVMLTTKGKEKLKEMHRVMEKAKLTVEKKFTKSEILNHKNFISKLNKILDSEEKELANLLITYNE